MIKRIIILILLLIILVPAALVGFIQYTDWGNQSAKVSEFLTGKMGRKVEVSGPLALQIFPKPYVKLGGLTLAAYDGDKPLLETGAIEINADLASLMKFQLMLEKVSVDTVNVHLAVAEDGDKNWEPKRKSRSGSGGLSALDMVTSYGNIIVSNINVEYDNKPLAKNYTFKEGQLAIDGKDLTEVRQSLTGVLLGEKFAYSSVKDLSSLMSKVEFKDEVSFKGQSVAVDGVLADPFGKPVLRTKFDYASPDALAFVKEFIELGADFPLTSLADFKLQGELVYEKSELEIEEFQLATVGANLAGSAVISEDMYQTKLKIVNTNTELLGLNLKTAGNTNKSANWSDEVIDLSLFQDLNVKSQIQLENVAHNGRLINKANLIFDLAEGMLKLTKFDVQMAEGKIDVSGRVDLGTPMRAKLKGEVVNFMPTRWMRMAWLNYVRGAINGTFDVSFKGVSVAQMMRSLSGKVALQSDSLAVKGFKANDLAGTLARMVNGQTNNQYQLFDPIELDIDIDNGVLKTKDTQLKAGNVELFATGKFDLGNQTINYKLTPNITDENMPIILPVLVRGPVANPQIIPDLPDMAAQGAMELIGGEAGVAIGNMLKGVQGENADAQEAAPATESLPFNLEDPEKLRESLQKFLNESE